MTWYWAFSVGFVELAYFRFDLWKLEREMRTAAPPNASPVEFKESFVRLYMDSTGGKLDKELSLQVIANRKTMTDRHNWFSNVFKRQLSDVFLAVQIAVSSNAALIAAKFKEVLDMLVGFAS